MVRSVLAFVAIVIASFLPAAFAKAYHPTLRETIKAAEYIAIVDIGSGSKTDAKGKHFRYMQVFPATLVDDLKGTLPGRFKIFGSESFECAQCNFVPGRAIVFLKKDSDLFVGHGWSIACRPIKDGKVA